MTPKRQPKSPGNQSKVAAKPSTPKKPKWATKVAIQAALERLDASYELGTRLKDAKPISEQRMLAIAKNYAVGKSYSNL